MICSGFGVAASVRNVRLREFTFARCAVGRLRQGLREFFFTCLAVVGAAASGGKLRLREFTYARCTVGRLRQRLRDFFSSLSVLGERLEIEIARIYVRTLCRWAGAGCWKLSSREFTFQLVVVAAGKGKRERGTEK